MNIKHIIIVILIIIVFLLIMIGKGNDKIDKDVTKAASNETGISTRETVAEQKAETSNEDSKQQVIEKSKSAEAKSEEDLFELESLACPSGGSCGGQFTANTMACVSEALFLPELLPVPPQPLSIHFDYWEPVNCSLL